MNTLTTFFQKIVFRFSDKKYFITSIRLCQFLRKLFGLKNRFLEAVNESAFIVQHRRCCLTTGMFLQFYNVE
jgi:hypothetical protein